MFKHVTTILFLIYSTLLEAQCPVVLEGKHSMCNGLHPTFYIANYTAGATYQAFAVVNGTATANFTISGTGIFTASLPNGTTQAMVIVKVTNPCQSADTIWLQPCCGQDPPNSNVLTDIQTSQIPNIAHPGNYIYDPTTYPAQAAAIVIHGQLDVANVTEFYNTTLYMDQGASFRVKNNKELVFINCTVQAYCNAMWEGIICDDGSKFKIRNNSVIRDAQYGLKCTGNVIFDMTNNIQFINNYAGVYAPPNASGNTFSFGQTSSQSININWNGTNLLSNFYGQNPVAQTRSYAGLLLYDMPAFTNNTGSNGDFGVTISNTTIGIAAFRSNVTIPGNVTITNIAATAGEYPNSSAYNGTGIYADALSTTVSKTLNVGTNSTQYATVQNCRYGIFVNNNMNLNCQYNTIQNISDMGSVRVKSCGSRSLDITWNQINNGYHVGIYCQYIDNATLHIFQNTLNNGATYKPANVALGNTAIYVVNKTLSIVNGYISNNHISNSRVGIDVGSVKGAGNASRFYISSNDITISRANTLTALYDYSQLNPTPWIHYGIKVRNTSNVQVSDNVITRTLAVPANTVVPSYPTIIYGIETNITTANTYVKNNTLKDFGTFVNITGNCSGTYYQCNTCSLTVVNSSNNTNTRGFYFNMASLTNQGSLTSPSDNTWAGWGAAADPKRLAGGVTGNAFTWYHRNASNIYYATPAAVSGTALTINSSTSGQGPCVVIPPDNPDELLRKLDDIIYNRIVYEYFPEESRMQDVRWAFNVLYDNPDLRGSDAAYEAFYQEHIDDTPSNFNRIEQYLNDKDYAAALAALDEMETGSNTAANLKYILDIATRMSENPYYELSEQQVAELTRIAYLNVWEAGEAAIYARAILDVDIIDLFPYLRKAATTNSADAQNPTLQQLLRQSPYANITVYDSAGKTVFTGNVTGFDMMRNKLSTGLYSYTVDTESKTISGTWYLNK